MSPIFVILWMIFFHVVADYNLQGWLASAKQKSWWEENYRYEIDKYKHDYIWALIMHSLSWSFMIMLPIAYAQQFDVGIGFALMFALNVVIHAIVDTAKANLKLINLWQDQFMHMVQILITALVLYI